MKLICPKCRAGVKIGGASRFEEFQCKACDYCFMGLEAEVRWMSRDTNRFEVGGHGLLRA
jgi:transposase-like protein